MKLFLVLFVISFSREILSENEISEIASNLLHLISDPELKSNERFDYLQNQLSYINSLVVNRNEYEKILKDESGLSKQDTILFDAISQVNSSKTETKSSSSENVYETFKDILKKLDKAKKLGSNSQSRHKRTSSADVVNTGETGDLPIVGKRKKYINDRDVDEKFTSKNKDVTPFNDTRRIFYGINASILSYPFMASVHLVGRFVCAGVVLNEDLVLTTASCLTLLYNNRWYRETPQVLKVRIGSNYPNSEGDLNLGLQVYFHPNFDPKTLAFNVAIIRMENFINLTVDDGPRAANLSDIVEDLSTGTKLTVLGWGISTRPKYIFYEQQILKKSIMPVISKRDCWYYYGEDHLGYSTFCSGTFGRGSGACGRGQGGPAMHKDQVVGIVSEGPPKCEDYALPTVITHISRVSNWIRQVLQDNTVTEKIDHGDNFVNFDLDFFNEDLPVNKGDGVVPVKPAPGIDGQVQPPT